MQPFRIGFFHSASFPGDLSKVLRVSVGGSFKLLSTMPSEESLYINSTLHQQRVSSMCSIS